MKAMAFAAIGGARIAKSNSKAIRLLLLGLSMGVVGCGDGSDGGEPVQGGGGGSVTLSPVCGTLNSFLQTDPDPAALQVTGYSFVLFDRETTLLTCDGGDQALATPRAIASASKLASAAAIMTLVDEGRLDLDVPVAEYLRGSGVNWPPDKSSITMRMLLSHTSGLPGLADESNPDCTYEDTQWSLQACVQQIADTPLVTSPDVYFNYGAASYQVAGYVATVLAGQSWQELFTARVSGPL